MNGMLKVFGCCDSVKAKFSIYTYLFSLSLSCCVVFQPTVIYISYILYRTVHVMHTVCNLHVHNQTSCRVIPMCIACMYIIYQRHDTCVKHSSAS